MVKYRLFKLGFTYYYGLEEKMQAKKEKNFSKGGVEFPWGDMLLNTRPAFRQMFDR